MVDCIVPATGPGEIALAHEFGVDDPVAVTHENFRQWVIEDDFCAGRPDWQKVGAEFSDRVPDFERMKIRILNAGHQVIANPGEILSIETISSCMEHPLIRSLLRKVVLEEIAPHVAPVPGMSPSAYFDLIETRFSNPAIVDTTRRVAFDGSSRHAGFLLPTIFEGLATNTSVEGLALVEAMWARMCEGTREDGSVIHDNDPSWQTLVLTAKRARENPSAWLEQTPCYGELASESRFADPFKNWLRMIWAEGLESASLELCRRPGIAAFRTMKAGRHHKPLATRLPGGGPLPGNLRSPRCGSGGVEVDDFASLIRLAGIEL